MNCIQCEKEIQDGDITTSVNDDNDMTCSLACYSLYIHFKFKRERTQINGQDSKK